MTETDKPPRGLDSARLESWLRDNVAGAAPPFSYTLIAGGHSNLTYAVDDAAGVRRVLRRPPLGAVHLGAHDMAREYTIQAGLAGSRVPVAAMLAMCQDAEVIGAPFYVMQYVEGEVVDSPGRARRALPDAAARRVAAESLVDALAALHGVDIDAAGLGALGPRAGYVKRQPDRLLQVWNRTRTRELPIIESLHARLLARMPEEIRPNLVHADYRLGNAIIDGGSHRVAAVLDWELAAIGDPRADLALLVNNWDQPGDTDVWMAEAPTRAGGFPTQEELVARYTAQTGTGNVELDYFRAFGYWRLAVIAEGIKRRYEASAMGGSTDIGAVEKRVRQRADLAAAFLDRAGS